MQVVLQKYLYFTLDFDVKIYKNDKYLPLYEN